MRFFHFIKFSAIFSVFIFCTSLGFASVPASLEGYTLGISTFDGSTFTESSLTFRAGGLVQENWRREGSGLSEFTFGIIGDYSVPKRGTYIYNKISDSFVEFTMAWENGAANEKWTLQSINGSLQGTPRPGVRLTLDWIAPSVSSLINISTRVKVRSGEPTIIGFIVAERADFVLRVAGPALAAFQVPGPWPSPQFQFYGQSGHIRLWSRSDILDRTGLNPPPPWDSTEGFRVTNTQGFQRAGAFPFATGSKDVAAVVSLDPGPYTVIVQPAAGDPGGEALIEVYQLR